MCEKIPLVYMLRCRDNSLYCGWTNDMEKRLRDHEMGLGAKYTRGRGPLKLVYVENCATREEAMKREYAIKRLSKAEKEALVRHESF